MGFSPWRGAELTREQYEALTRPGNVAVLAYDGFDRVTQIRIDGVTYDILYTSSTITITGDDGSVKTITLDGSGRISGASNA
jgi:hypothetical protein